MKNKKVTTYLLLLFVLIIWGYIFYKFFSDIKEPEPLKPKVINTMNDHFEKDTSEFKFNLNANYRDPFLGNVFYTETSTRSFVKIKPTVKIENTSLKWPPILYKGIIKNKSIKKGIGLLVIAGKEYIVSPQQMIDSFLIFRLYKDSISVCVRKKCRTFAK